MMCRLRGVEISQRRATLGAALLAMLVGGAWPTHAEPTPAPGYTDTRVLGFLNFPTAIAFLPDGRLVIAEKNGGVRLAGNPPEAVVPLAGQIGVCHDYEMGLLGVAVDPNFAVNHRLFFYRTENDGGCQATDERYNEVVSTILEDGQIGPLTTVLTGIRAPIGEHAAGALRIGPDGKLYVGVGDTGLDDFGLPGQSMNPYSQDLAALEGKILRLNLDGSIPGDNPFVGNPAARGEIFAYGFRNPFRMGFDPQTGHLWLAEPGQHTVDEVDIVVPGGNYGWPQCEATLPAGCPGIGAPGAPVYEYLHPPGTGVSLIGGAFVTGGPQRGRYIFAEFESGLLLALDVNSSRTGVTGSPTEIVRGTVAPVDIIFGPDGALYYAAIGSGEVRRVYHPDFCEASGPCTTLPTTTTSAAPTTSTSTTTTSSLTTTTVTATTSTTVTATTSTTTTTTTASPTTTTVTATTTTSSLTTTSVTVTTTTSSLTTTSETSTTTTFSQTTASITTSTTTTAVTSTTTATSSTTTTLRTPGCEEVPAFPCTIAALEDVIALVARLDDVGRLDDQLRRVADRARLRLMQAASTPSTPSVRRKRQLGRVSTVLDSILRRLDRGRSRRRFDPALRAAVQSRAAATRRLVLALSAL